VLAAAQTMFLARQRAGEICQPRARKRTWDWLTAGQYFFHRSLELTDNNVIFALRCRLAGLSETEVEIVAALLLSQLSMADGDLNICARLFAFLGVMGTRAVAAQRGLSGEGPLYDSGLLQRPSPEERFDERTIEIDPNFVEDVLHNHDSRQIGWAVKNEDELHKKLAGMIRINERACR